MHKRYLICLLDSNILLTIRLFSAQNDIAIRFYFNKATVKYGAFNKHWKEPVDSPYLYKTGANLYDRNRFAPVLLFHFIFTRLTAIRRQVR